jgi:hypothetical protein
MKDAFLFLLLAAVAYLVYDDYSKRDALKQMQTQVQQQQSRPSNTLRRQGSTPVPAWFQKHLDQGSLLEQSYPHRHQDEQLSATSTPTYPH